MSQLPSAVDVVIIGAGAAGLMSAITAGRRGRRVLVLDHANKVGKKILMSGGGRCNFTNMEVQPSNYLSANSHFCKSALSRYSQWDFIAMVAEHQIPYHEKTLGQLFCDNKASDILTMLLEECQRAGAEVHSRCSVDSIKAIESPDGVGDADENNKADSPARYRLQTSLGSVSCESLVVATGGLSIPTMGATGFGYKIASQFGLALKPTRAGLVPFTLQPAELEVFAAHAGSSLEVRASCFDSQGCEQSFFEQMLFTHRGLSGPAILQISSYWCPGQPVTIDLLPRINLADYLAQMQRQRPKVELKNLLGELLTKKLAQCFCDLWCQSKPINQYSAKQLNTIGEQFHRWQIVPSGTEGYRTAEVTLGGVDCDELSSKTMQAKKQPGLYFVGEVVDVTGHLGGFNFQWAWASGYAAGCCV